MQYSISKPILCEDIGIHTGNPVKLSFHPAPIGSGLVFKRSDLSEKSSIKVTPNVFSGENNMTCILHNGVQVFKTVEHVLSAIHGLGIDNLIIETNSAEMPIIDGSAQGFISLLQKAGIVEQAAAERPSLIIKKPIFEKGKDDTFLIALPANEFKISVITEYAEYPFIGLQIFSKAITKELYVKEIGPARTLGKVKDLNMMHAKGLGLGVTLNNAIGIGEEGYSCELRYPDEIVRHKAMDLIGDLGGLERQIKGHIIGYKPNHRLNIQFMKRLAQN